MMKGFRQVRRPSTMVYERGLGTMFYDWFYNLFEADSFDCEEGEVLDDYEGTWDGYRYNEEGKLIHVAGYKDGYGWYNKYLCQMKETA